MSEPASQLGGIKMMGKMIKHAKVINRKYGKMYLLVGPALDENGYSLNLDIKILEILPRYKTSYHYHDNIESVFIVLSGKLVAKINDNTFIVEKGDYILIKPFIKHQLINESDDTAFVMEIMTPPYAKSHTIYEEEKGVSHDD